jgi:DNA-binding NarL/FixJ family response regulator
MHLQGATGVPPAGYNGLSLAYSSALARNRYPGVGDRSLDIGMPGLDGLQAARQIRELNATTAVVVLSMHDSDHDCA